MNPTEHLCESSTPSGTSAASSSMNIPHGGFLSFQFLNTDETISQIANLISDSREKVWLVTPYFKMDSNIRLVRSIEDALSRNVAVSVVIRQDETGNRLDVLQALVKLGLKVYDVPWLHAKLYWSEQQALVTSLNLLESSFRSSLEVGMLIRDPVVRDQVREFIEVKIRPRRDLTELLRKGLGEQRRESEPHREAPKASPAPTRVERPERQLRSKKAERRPREEGHCIRCSDRIPLNPERPYCRDDYEAWAEYQNIDYRDRYCHICGNEHPATMRKPLCYDCYQQQNDDGIPF